MTTFKRLLLAGLLAAGLIPLSAATGAAAPPTAEDCQQREYTGERGASDIEEATSVAFELVGSGFDTTFGDGATATFALGTDPDEATCEGILYRALITPIDLTGTPVAAPFVGEREGDGSNPLVVDVAMGAAEGWDRICVEVELETVNLSRDRLLDSGTDGAGNVVCAGDGQGFKYR